MVSNRRQLSRSPDSGNGTITKLQNDLDQFFS